MRSVESPPLAAVNRGGISDSRRRRCGTGKDKIEGGALTERWLSSGTFVQPVPDTGYLMVRPEKPGREGLSDGRSPSSS